MHRRIDSSSIIAHPVNFQWERLLEYYAKNSTYIYICIWRSRKSIRILYISSTWDWLHHFSVFFHGMFWKKKVFKSFKIRQVCDWLAKWLIMLGFMDLRWPRVFLRFLARVGLLCIEIFYIFPTFHSFYWLLSAGWCKLLCLNKASTQRCCSFSTSANICRTVLISPGVCMVRFIYLFYQQNAFSLIIICCFTELLNYHFSPLIYKNLPGRCITF